MSDHMPVPTIKRRSTFFTEKKVAQARENIKRYEWAKILKDTAVSKAGKFLSMGVDFLWESVTTQKLPRSYAVNQEKGCPVCGRGLYKFGTYSWIVDHFEKPWKMECPNCHIVLPSNDFQKYYRSGLDKKGRFEPELADRSFLKNTMHPDKPDSWGVDDGYGWISEDGSKWALAAYYNTFGIWTFGNTGNTYTNDLYSALRAFRDAFLFTGDEKYACAGIILLDRIADIFPDMDSSAYHPGDGFRKNDGGTNQGIFCGSIGDSVVVTDLVSSYDAFFPVLQKENEADFLKFLREKARMYEFDNSKCTVSHIRKNIEDNILCKVFDRVKTAKIRGNLGMHQSCLAMAAVVLDNPEMTEDWIEWIFKSGGLVKNENFELTGGNISSALIEEIDRDGFINENASAYINACERLMKTLGDILADNDFNREYDLYRNVKYVKMLESMHHLVMIGRYIPPIGDSARTGDPGIYSALDFLTAKLARYDNPVTAQLLDFLKDRTGRIGWDIFNDRYDGIMDKIACICKKSGKIHGMKSDNLTGFGFTALRDGEDRDGKDTQRGAWMYYGGSGICGHMHYDKLSIGIYAFGLDLSPDLGYPEYTADCPSRHEWTNNTISHNTAVVDAGKQLNSTMGLTNLYEDGDMVKLIDAGALSVYPQTSVYRRLLVMVKVDDGNSYYVDVFRIKGGNEHVYSFHGAEGSVAVDGPELEKQSMGTYAGVDVEFMQAYDNAAGTRTGGYTGSGYHYLYNVERSSPTEKFSVDWSVKDTWKVLKNKEDIHLRLTMLSGVDEAALADGDPPQNKEGNPRRLKYLIAKRNGKNLESQFVSVIEPYRERRFIRSIEKITVAVGNGKADESDVAAVKVTLTDGRTDYIVCAADSSTVYTADGRIRTKGSVCFCSEKKGKVFYGFAGDGSLVEIDNVKLIEKPYGSLTGEVSDFTKSLEFENEVAVNINEKAYDIDDLKGRFIYIENDRVRNAAYEIKGAKKAENGALIVDIGDSTLIRSYKDKNDFDKGYVYDIAEGSKIRIPLSYKVS